MHVQNSALINVNLRPPVFPPSYSPLKRQKSHFLTRDQLQIIQNKINAMDDLINSGAEAVSDPDGALMVVSAINSIIGGRMFNELFFFYLLVMCSLTSTLQNL